MFAFVRPPAPFNRYIQNVPLNYIHLAAWLRQAGREVHILDMVLDSVTPDYADRFIREHSIRVGAPESTSISSVTSSAVAPAAARTCAGVGCWSS